MGPVILGYVTIGPGTLPQLHNTNNCCSTMLHPYTPASQHSRRTPMYLVAPVQATSALHTSLFIPDQRNNDLDQVSTMTPPHPRCAEMSGWPVMTVNHPPPHSSSIWIVWLDAHLYRDLVDTRGHCLIPLHIPFPPPSQVASVFPIRIWSLSCGVRSCGASL